MLCLYTLRLETPILIQQSMRQAWYDASVPSPSKGHSKIRKDNNGNWVKLPSGEYCRVQKWYYSKEHKDIYEDWKIKFHRIIQELYLDRQRSIPVLKTFESYRPYEIEKMKKYLTQMLCDNCVPFEYLFEGLMQYLSSICKCGTTVCNNYRRSMGPQCTCINCSNCMIRQLKELKPHDLLDYCTCQSGDLFPFMDCASGKCDNTGCNVDRFRELLVRARGCQYYNPRARAQVSYKFIQTIPINGKNYKTISNHSMPLHAFTHAKFLESLKNYLWHKFVHRKQNYEKKILFTKVNNVYLLPEGWIFVTIDFISNYQLSAGNTTHGMGLSMMGLSMMVMYERMVRNNQLIETAITTFSDAKTHGWQTAMPVLDYYVTTRKTELQREGIELKLIKLHSDRGPHDFWCSPSHLYLTDIVRKYEVPITHDTTAAGESKSYHDQIGGTIKNYLDRCNLILDDAGTRSSQIVAHLKANFHHDKSGKLRRRFWELPANIIYYGSSPCHTFEIPKGIKRYHGAYITAKAIWYRTTSCNCTYCVTNMYKKTCPQRIYCGKWVKFAPIPKHLQYSRLRDQYNANQSNNNV